MENFEFKSVKFHLKIDLVSHPASVNGLVYILVHSQKENQQNTLWEAKNLFPWDGKNSFWEKVTK